MLRERYWAQVLEKERRRRAATRGGGDWPGISISDKNMRTVRLRAAAMSDLEANGGWMGPTAQHSAPTRPPQQLLRSGAGLFKMILRFLKLIYLNFLDYTKLSSMHGLRYIGDNSLHPAARIFWVFAFFWAVGCSAYFISNLFIKFHEMPVIMSISPTSSTIRDIPFPSITICNMNNMRKQQVEFVQNLYELTKGNGNFSGETALDYKLIYDYCNREPEEDIPIPSNVSANWDYIKKFMIKMTQPCHEMLVYCRWHGDPVPCDEIFNPNLTDEGMCCVFNRLKREFIFSNPKDVSDLNVTFPGEVYEWTPERGYPDGMSFETVPRRARGSGTHLGLTVVADAEMQQYYCSSGNSKGFKIFMSNPLETPKLMSFAVPLAPGSESNVVIIPKQVTSTRDLQSIAIEKRNCYFEEEKRLFFYKTYTQRSCILECEANYTIVLCGCVQYYMPKNETTRICGRNDAKCASQAQRKLDISINDAFQNLSAKGIDVPICACLPGCYELSYGFVQSSTPITTAFQIDQEMAGDKDTAYFSENMGIIHFYYMEKQFSGTVKGVLFGFTEFLSNTGGLLGLFMGFSVLSGVEILYFLLIRIITLFAKANVKAKSNRTSEINNTKSKIDINFLNEHSKILKNQYPYTQ